MIGTGYIHRSEWHYIDHVGPICDLLEIPLIFFDETEQSLAKEFYPLLKTELLSLMAFTFEYTLSHYDYLVASGIMGREVLKRKIQAHEKKFQKTLRFVHCPHGFSDKIVYLSLAAHEDITLIYGQNHLDHFKALHVLDQLHAYVWVGNYRYLYYQKYKNHCDRITEEKIFSHFERKSPCILYAPTWSDYDDTSTFAVFCSRLITLLPDAYNLIIKIHPRLRIESEAEYTKIVNACAYKRNVIIVDQFPLIYPLLARTDIYIGDASSIGYDFLTFSKPMFFLNKLRRDPFIDRRAYLFRCGTVVNPEDFDNLFSIIEESLPTDSQQFEAIRAEVYAYTFGNEHPLENIKEDILAAVRQR